MNEKSRFRRRVTTSIAIMTAASLALSACGGSDSSSDGDGPTQVTLAVLPFIDVAPAYLGVEQGFFEDEGLDVNIKTVNSGAATVTGVVSGDYQFAFTGWLPFMQAKQSNVPVQAVANAQFQTSPETHSTAERTNQDVLVSADSPIRDAAGLEGATIGVNQLKGVQEVLLRNTLDMNGVPQDSVELVELPFPNMAETLDAGRVDAVFVGEPFETVALDAGARIVATPYADTETPANLSLFIASDQYRAENEEVVEAFARAMQKSLTYAQDNQDEARQIVTTYTEIAEDLLERVQLPFWGPEVSVESVQEQAELGQKYGALTEEPDVNALVSTVVE